MAKVTRRDPLPGEKFFGGKGFLIPFKPSPIPPSLTPSKPEQEPQVKPTPEQNKTTPQLPE